jgi:hypothetical protein
MLTGDFQNDLVAMTRPGIKRTGVSAVGPSGYVASDATVCVVSPRHQLGKAIGNPRNSTLVDTE